jgi:hypothetical protein
VSRVKNHKNSGKGCGSGSGKGGKKLGKPRGRKMLGLDGEPIGVSTVAKRVIGPRIVGPSPRREMPIWRKLKKRNHCYS